MKWIDRLQEKHKEIISNLERERKDKEEIDRLFINNKKYFFKIVDRYRKQIEYQKNYRLKKKLESVS